MAIPLSHLLHTEIPWIQLKLLRLVVEEQTEVGNQQTIEQTTRLIALQQTQTHSLLLMPQIEQITSIETALMQWLATPALHAGQNGREVLVRLLQASVECTRLVVDALHKRCICKGEKNYIMIYWYVYWCIDIMIYYIVKYLYFYILIFEYIFISIYWYFYILICWYFHILIFLCFDIFDILIFSIFWYFDNLIFWYFDILLFWYFNILIFPYFDILIPIYICICTYVLIYWYIKLTYSNCNLGMPWKASCGSDLMRL